MFWIQVFWHVTLVLGEWFQTFWRILAMPKPCRWRHLYHSKYQNDSPSDIASYPGRDLNPQIRGFKKKGNAVPLQAWTGPEGCTKLWLPDLVTTAQDGGKFVSPTHRPPLPPGNTPDTHSFLLETELTPGPYCDQKDFMSMKNPLTPARIEPATFWFVARHLNHCANVAPS